MIQVYFTRKLCLNGEEQAEYDWNLTVIRGDILQFENGNFQDKDPEDSSLTMLIRSLWHHTYLIRVYLKFVKLLCLVI